MGRRLINDNEVIQKEIGRRLRILRKQKNLSLLSVAIEVNINQNYLNDIELGRRNLTLKMLIKLCNFYEITLSELFKETETK